jgi:predicted metal-dependent phosphotriesterase family hydrolase
MKKISQFFLVAIALLSFQACIKKSAQIITVNGSKSIEALGFSLPHEHILVDFIGADSIMPGRYQLDSVAKVALPFLLDLKNSGFQSLIDCTPNFLGRDVKLLQRLSTESGLNIVTNTGYYGAANQKFLPRHVFIESAEQLADRWITEFENGIDGTEIKPGFIKLGADEGPLTEAQQKIMKAGAIAHKQTGLTIAVHCGDGKAAREVLDILTAEGVAANAFVWVHAQNEKDFNVYKEMASKGVWVEFDNVSPENIEMNVAMLKFMKEQNLLHQTLISHDAGWYHVGEKNGGNFRGFTSIHKELMPALKENGFTQEEIELLIRKNPVEAFALRVREN